jgi:hypothetical protein
MRELRVDMFSTVDGYGSGGPRPAPYWGLRRTGPVRMDPSAAGRGARRAHGRNVVSVDVRDRRERRRPDVFSKTLRPPLTWANTTFIDEPVETAVPALKAKADGLPMRTIGSRRLRAGFGRWRRWVRRVTDTRTNDPDARPGGSTCHRVADDLS